MTPQMIFSVCDNILRTDKYQLKIEAGNDIEPGTYIQVLITSSNDPSGVELSLFGRNPEDYKHMYEELSKFYYERC